MKKRFINRREMLVLGLPLFLVGVGGVILTARERKRIERESGPLRLVVTSAKTIELTPREAWQGYDVKYRLDYELQGESASTIALIGNMAIKDSMITRLNILEKSGKVQLFTGTQVDESTYIEPHIQTPLKIIETYYNQKETLHNFILVDRDAFPSGIATLESHSQFRGENLKRQEVITPSANWSHVIDKDLKAVNIDQTSAKFLVNSLQIAPPIVVEHRMAMYESRNMQSFGSNLNLEWDVNGLANSRGQNQIEFLNSRFEDANGNKVHVENEEEYMGVKYYSLQAALNPIYDKSAYPIPNRSYTNISLNLHNVPNKYGAIFLRSNLSINDSWATPFRVEVRPDWVCQKPKNLKFEGITFNKNVASVIVRYTGQKPLEYEHNSQASPFSPYGHYFSAMTGNDNSYDPPLKPSSNRLIINWSQHLENKKGRFFFIPSTQHNISPSKICEIQQVVALGYGRYQIDYAVSHPKSAGMKFKAEIGIWGDGFIPVEITIPKTK